MPYQVERRSMSTFKVEAVRIKSIEPHPNADRLELAQILDWRVVVGKNMYRVGELVIYLPIDSILPANVESVLFPIDSKVKLNKSRIRTIKLRGAVSQGMVAKPETLGLTEVKEGQDVTAKLGITKYEPAEAGLPSGMNVGKADKKKENPHFKKYGGIENAKNYPTLFNEAEEVVITEKIHGSNFRCGYVPFFATTLWDKIRKWLGMAPAYEFVYGSNNVQLQKKMSYKGYYDKNIYAEAVVNYKLDEILKPNEVVYGEVYGDGVQKGYTYGCKPGERKFIVFDVKVNDKYLDPVAAQHFCKERGLPFVPVLYQGPFNKENALHLTKGHSKLSPTQPIREGVVVKMAVDRSCYIGRKMLKFISDDYLLKEETSFQ